MRVVLFLRSDLAHHTGGQGEKAKRYIQFLEAAGVEATIWPSDDQPPGRYEIGHVFNLDWPVESARQIAAARRCCDRVVLSTIHHRNAWMEELHRRARRGPAAAVARFSSLETFEAIRGLALAVRRPSQIPESTRQLIRGVRSTQRSLLAAVDLCLTLAEGERRSLVEDLSFTGPTAHVPNAASEADGDLPPGLPQDFLLSIGRLEARKNQLPLTSVVERLDLPLVLVGPPNPRHAAIVAEIARRADRSSRLIWFRHLSREQVLAMLRRAQAHVLTSWCEVVPQVDLEAALAGTRVVTTTRGYTDEYLGGSAVYWDPSSGLSALEAAITSALARAPAAPSRPDELRWEHAGERLREAYARALTQDRPARV